MIKMEAERARCIYFFVFHCTHTPVSHLPSAATLNAQHTQHAHSTHTPIPTHAHMHPHMHTDTCTERQKDGDTGVRSCPGEGEGGGVGVVLVAKIMVGNLIVTFQERASPQKNTAAPRRHTQASLSTH